MASWTEASEIEKASSLSLLGFKIWNVQVSLRDFSFPHSVLTSYPASYHQRDFILWNEQFSSFLHHRSTHSNTHTPLQICFLSQYLPSARCQKESIPINVWMNSPRKDLPFLEKVFINAKEFQMLNKVK